MNAMPAVHDRPISITLSNKQSSSVINTLTKVFWAVVAPLDPFIGMFVTQPLADILALKTYTHGTNFTNYLNIRCFGGDPSKGGSDTGSTAVFEVFVGAEGKGKEELENCKGHFYLFKDISDVAERCIVYMMDHKVVEFTHGPLRRLQRSELGYRSTLRRYTGTNGKMIVDKMNREVPKYECAFGSNHTEFITFGASSDKYADCMTGEYPASSDKYYVRSLLPMRHAVFSGMANWATLHEKGIIATAKRIVGAISGLLTPTISIRVAEGDRLNNQLEVDPDFPLLAYKTSRRIPSCYMGLVGIIYQGVQPNLWQRIKKAPIKASLGALRLLVLVTAMWSVYSYK